MTDCRIDNFIYSKHHDSNSCCDYINQRKCTVKFETKLWEPLETTYPSLVGELDEDQLELIKMGCMPLILMENASEFVGRIKNIPGFLEKLIQKIIDDNKSDYVSLGSHSIMFREEKYDTLEEIEEAKKERERLIKKLKKTIKPGKKHVIQLALDFEEYGGHYSIIFQTEHGLIVFDSMQGIMIKFVNDKGNVEYKRSKSSYTDIFSDFAEDLFGQNPFAIIENMVLSPQPTGGFVNKDNYETKEVYLQASQDMESQNHYCYFWSIAYFHIFLIKGLHGLVEIFQIIKCNHNHPLTFIKKYIWGTLNMMYPSHNYLEKLFRSMLLEWGSDADIAFLVKFFLMHFRYIWDDLDGNFSAFSIIPCDLSEVRSFKSMNDVMAYAYEKTPYVIDRISLKRKMEDGRTEN